MKKQQRIWLLLIIGLMIFHFLSLRVALLNGERVITTHFEQAQEKTPANEKKSSENIDNAKIIDNETFLQAIKQHHARILNNHVITQLFLLLLLGTYIKKRYPKIKSNTDNNQSTQENKLSTQDNKLSAQDTNE